MRSYDSFFKKYTKHISDNRPIAVAELKSSVLCSQIHGATYFYATQDSRGILIASVFFGLPENKWYDLCIYSPCSRGKRISYKEQPRLGCKSCCDPQALVGIYGNDGCAFSAYYSEAVDKSSLIGLSLLLMERSSSSTKDNFELLACGLITPVS